MTAQRSRRAIGFVLPALIALACAGGASSGEPTETKNHPRKHVMVQFTDMSMHPTTAQLLEGGTVSWVNYASMYRGSIAFSDAVAAAFTCSDLRPNWMKTGTGYQSIPITMGSASDDLQIPCPLKPGSYDYELWLFSAGDAGFGGEGMEDPQIRLKGKIVVQ